ncbi:MAG: hypothetical protein LN413_05740 [Candidatus Thermoplasmatota archaeon]|nr:hypothetical protein [Candidatus Thermoplasmatota archaeon]
MSETRRAWSPERVEHLLVSLDEIAAGIEDLVEAERHVGDVLDKALTAPPNGKAEEP